MLLHNTNINVAIADILSYIWSLYDLQKPSYTYRIFAPEGNFENWAPRAGTTDLNCVPR